MKLTGWQKLGAAGLVAAAAGLVATLVIGHNLGSDILIVAGLLAVGLGLGPRR